MRLPSGTRRAKPSPSPNPNPNPNPTLALTLTLTLALTLTLTLALTLTLTLALTRHVPRQQPGAARGRQGDAALEQLVRRQLRAEQVGRRGRGRLP